MTNAPEKIWARPIMGYEDRPHGPWALDNPFGNATSYLRSDLAEAQIAAAYEAAAKAMECYCPPFACQSQNMCIRPTQREIYALTPSSAKSTLDALLQAERERCARVAENSIHQECCNCPHVEQVGPEDFEQHCCRNPVCTPMLPEEIAAAIRNLNEGEG